MTNLDDMIDALRQHGDLKVWSLIVTLLGDSSDAAPEGIAGPEISALMRRLSIKSEALRVALHRLRRDGWIDSTKHGRMSVYRMSAKARQETEAVRDFVYAKRLSAPRELWLVTGEVEVKLSQSLALTRNAALMVSKPSGSYLSARIELEDLPGWARDKLMPAEHVSLFQNLYVTLQSRTPSVVDGEEAMALRLMILHTWRRLVLRHEPLALSLLPADHPASLCRGAVSAWLATLPRFSADLQPSA